MLPFNPGAEDEPNVSKTFDDMICGRDQYINMVFNLMMCMAPQKKHQQQNHLRILNKSPRIQLGKEKTWNHVEQVHSFSNHAMTNTLMLYFYWITIGFSKTIGDVSTYPLWTAVSDSVRNFHPALQKKPCIFDVGGSDRTIPFFSVDIFIFVYRYIHSFKSRVRIQKDIMISLLMGE